MSTSKQDSRQTCTGPYSYISSLGDYFDTYNLSIAYVDALHRWGYASKATHAIEDAVGLGRTFSSLNIGRSIVSNTCCRVSLVSRRSRLMDFSTWEYWEHTCTSNQTAMNLTAFPVVCQRSSSLNALQEMYRILSLIVLTGWSTTREVLLVCLARYQCFDHHAMQSSDSWTSITRESLSVKL